MSSALSESPSYEWAIERCFTETGISYWTRGQLVRQTGLSDRVVRDAIAELVKAGAPILSDREHGGYRWSRDHAEIRAEIALLHSHAARIRERAQALERHLEAEQGELFGTGA